VSVARLVLLVGAEVDGKTLLSRSDKVGTVSLENLVGLLHEGAHAALVESQVLDRALHATLRGADEANLSLTLGGHTQIDGVVVAIAAESLGVLESDVSGLIAELETIAHLDVSVAVLNDLPDKGGGHLYARVLFIKINKK